MELMLKREEMEERAGIRLGFIDGMEVDIVG